MKWECDGCGSVWDDEIPLEEQPKVINANWPISHIPEDLKGDIGGPICNCREFWGWMGMSGKAWFKLHDEGIHPMADLTSQTREFMKKRESYH